MDAKPVAAFCAALSLVGNLPPKPAEAAALLANNEASCGPRCHSEDRPAQAANIRLEAPRDSVVVNNTPLRFDGLLASGQISTVSLVDGVRADTTIQSVRLNISVPYDIASDGKKYTEFFTELCPTIRAQLPNDEWRTEWRGKSVIIVSCPDAYQPGSSQATQQLSSANPENSVMGQQLVEWTDSVINREFPMDAANPVALERSMFMVQESLLQPDILKSYGGREGVVREVLKLRYDKPKPNEANLITAALLSNFSVMITILPATKAPPILDMRDPGK